MDFQSENLMRKYLGLPPLAGGEEVSASFDGADAACTCACDAAPKKPQTLEQHLKQYHHGQMPKGDCSWLKQYKKDHPDWQKDAAKVSKGESAVDTADKGKKGDNGGKNGSQQSSNMMEWSEDDPRWGKSGWGSYKNYHQKQDAFHEKFVKINAWSWAKESGIPQKTVEAAMRAAWKIAPYRHGFHGVDLYKSEMSRYISAYRSELKRLTGKDGGKDTGKGKKEEPKKKDDKKSSASEYLDAVKKDKSAKKSSVGKKENLDDKGRYIPTQEEIDAACQAMSDSFDFSKEGVAKMVKDLIAGNRVWQGKDGGLLDIVQAMKGKGGVVRAIKERAKEQFIRDDHPWFKEDFWKNK